MKTATKKGYQYTTHRPDCACLPCRCHRGEVQSTKTAVSIRIEKTLKEDLQKVAPQEGVSLSALIEALLWHWAHGDTDLLKKSSHVYFPARQKR